MTFRALAAAMMLLAAPVLALDGDIGIHDPSTVVQAGGRFYVYGTGSGLPTLVSDDGWTWRRAGTVMQGLARRTPWSRCHRAGRQQHVGAGRDPRWRQVLHLLRRPRPTTQGRRGPAHWQDARSRCPGLQVGGRRAGRLVRWRRRQQRHRPRRLSRSHERVALADVRVLFRLHPPRRVESEDWPAPAPGCQAGRHRDQLRGVRHDLSRRLVLPTGHAWIVLCRRELDVQHPRGPGAKGDGPLSRRHGHRHASGRREAVRWIERPPHRPGAFRSARPRRRRAEVLLPL